MSFSSFRAECEKIAGAHASLLEKPPGEINADLALPCFSLAKEMKKAPQQIAKELVAKWYDDKDTKLRRGAIHLKREGDAKQELIAIFRPTDTIKEIRAEGPYVNFYADWDKLGIGVISEALKKGYGKGAEKRKMMVEFSGPNTNKPLHVGHLRNDSIGMAVSGILEFAGNAVLRSNIINDRGMHICKSMLAYKKWGEGKTPQSENKKPDHFVGDFYVLFEKKSKEDPTLKDEIQSMLVAWEKGDPTVRALWKKMNAWTLSGIKQTYSDFGSRFDLWPMESEFYDKAKPVLDEGVHKKLFVFNEKRDLVAKLDPLPDKVVLRADGTSVYITNDIALTKHRFESYKIDDCIWVVATEQDLHFQQLFKIFEKLGYAWAKNCYHLGYGLVNLPSGRMKTREGTVVDADDLIGELKKLAGEEIQKRDESIDDVELNSRSRAIALAAIKYFMLRVEPQKDILFDPTKAISFEGDTGPYLQYTHARASSVLRKAMKKAKAGTLDAQELPMIRKLAEFPEAAAKAAKELKPNIITTYLAELAALFNSYYHENKIIGSDSEEAKLALVAAVKGVLGLGMKLLNIEPIERM